MSAVLIAVDAATILAVCVAAAAMASCSQPPRESQDV